MESDPGSAVTASCALLESLFKFYIDERGLEMPSDQTVKPLWKVVRKDLKLDPDMVADNDLKTILGGLAATLDGIGSLRTHKGSAHGRGKKKTTRWNPATRVSPRMRRSPWRVLFSKFGAKTRRSDEGARDLQAAFDSVS